jgi:LCP family protein required for cell wall assembly
MAARMIRRTKTMRAAVITVAVLTVAGVGAFAYAYHHLNNNIRVFKPEGLLTDRPAPATPAAPTAQAPINLLLIGSDSRASGNEGLGGGQGVDGARSDTTILLHISGDRKHAVGVSIPRDSLVDIPACESNGVWYPSQTDVMFNGAFSEGNAANGNPTCTQNTVEAMSGIRIDHTIVLDFEGFATMSSAVGGVQVCVPQVDNSALEQAYGITLGPGVQTLSGKSALEYVRAREGFGDNSDIGRMKRQQAFLAALVKKVLDTGVYENPLTLYHLADAATSALTVDPTLDSVGSLETLALQMKGVPLKNLEFVTVPWQYDGSRVDLIQPDTNILWSLIKADRTLEGVDASGATPSPSAGTTTTTTTNTGASTSPSGAGTPTLTPAPVATAGTGPAVADNGMALKTDGSATAARTDASSTASPSAIPSVIPSGITENIRPADSNPCSDLSYGPSGQ